MNKLRVMTVFGTRPEAVKMCPLVHELSENEAIESIVCVTAQHRQMLDQVLKLFEVQPDYDLDVMQDRQTLVDITTRCLQRLDAAIKEARPDIVLVHGDTTTTFVASLAAFYNQVAIGHVEAGLRTYDKYSPFPEEMNRKLTGAMADLHFSPTTDNRRNLLAENVSDDRIYITGNTGIDALRYTVRADYSFENPVLAALDFEGRRVIAVTAHRRENLGEPLENICNAVLRVVNDNPDVQVVYPVHLNPAVREVVFRILGNHPRIALIDPLDVQEMHNLMKRAYMVMSDSGGVQEEAPSLNVPVLVLRNETERPEAVATGALLLAGTDEAKIYDLAQQLLTDEATYNRMRDAVNPYGDGFASRHIADALLYYFGRTTTRPKGFGI